MPIFNPMLVGGGTVLTGTVTASSANTITLPADVLAMDHFVCYTTDISSGPDDEAIVSIDETMTGTTVFVSQAEQIWVGSGQVQCKNTNGTVSHSYAIFPRGSTYRYIAWNG